MSDGERLRRPEPERTRPLRDSRSTLFRRPDPRERASSPQSEPAAPGEGRAPGNDVVARAVDLGYRVIDEYIQQGQRAARLLNDRSYGAEAMRNDALDFTVRMFRYASDFAELWFEGLAGAFGGQGQSGTEPREGEVRESPPTPQPPRARRAPPEEPADFGRTRVSVEVDSVRRTQVSVDLRAGAAEAPLVLHDLRAPEPEKPRLTDVSVAGGSGGAPVTFRIHVPEDQPAGDYSGLILDPQRSMPVGILCVHVDPQS